MTTPFEKLLRKFRGPATIRNRLLPDNINLVSNPSNTSNSPAQANLSGAGYAAERPWKGDIFKALIPEFLYKPPYGYPRRINVAELKLLAENGYVFSTVKALYDEASVVPWEIKVKEDFLEEGDQDYIQDKIKEIRAFFDKHNNEEDETFTDFIKELVTGMMEVDAGVIVKVFDVSGKFVQMFVRDGGAFLKNPNIFGTKQDRMPYIPPALMGWAQQLRIGATQDDASGGEIRQSNTAINWNLPPIPDQVRNVYDKVYLRNAAYFQYGWSAGSMPIPFGTREVVYISMNPRPDSIYGRSPLEVCKDFIYNLVYGAKYNSEFYTNNNMPDGVLQLWGANKQHMEIFKANLQQSFNLPSEFGKGVRKSFFKIPIVNADVKFVPFNMTPRDMQIINQQQWFIKVLWMCFGVNPDEMGQTDQESYNTASIQQRAFRRKAIAVLTSRIAEAINRQIIPEFFVDNVDQPLPSPAEIPVEFVFNAVDLEEKQTELNMDEQMIRMGVLTPDMVAEKWNINMEKREESLKKMYDDQLEQNMAREIMMEKMSSVNGTGEGNVERRLSQSKNPEQAAKRDKYRRNERKKERFKEK